MYIYFAKEYQKGDNYVQYNLILYARMTVVMYNNNHFI